VIPVFSRRLSMAADVASVQFSRTVERRVRRPASAHSADVPLQGRLATGTGGRRSLKTQQHAGIVAATDHGTPQVVRDRSGRAAIQPGSVDMLGPTLLDIAMPRGLGDRMDLSFETGPRSGHR
jgi:hypothetical protein